MPSRVDEQRECAVTACTGESSLRALPPFFFPGRLIKPTLEADFFSHCQQMPACICISTLPLKRHPGFFTATLH